MMNMHKLLDICDFQGGTQPPKEEWIDIPKEGYIRMLQIRDYSQGDEKFIQYVKDTKKLHKCQKDDIMLSRYGYIGQAFTGLAGAYNVALVKVVKKRAIDTRYLFYYFQSEYFQRSLLSNVGSRATIPGFNKTELKTTEIPVPSADEQYRIGERIAIVDSLIERHRQQIVLIEQLVKSRFIEMFGDLANPACVWPQAKLVETCADPDDIKCGPFGTQLSKDEYRNEGIALWEIPQINSQFKAKPTHYLDSDKAFELDAYSIKPGDIAMSRKGNVGRCAVFPCDYSPGIIHSDVLRIRVDTGKVSPVFMMYQLHYSGGVQRQIEQVSSGAIMAGINVTKLKSITVHLPPLDLQEQYAAFIAQTDKSKFTIRNSLQHHGKLWTASGFGGIINLDYSMQRRH